MKIRKWEVQRGEAMISALTMQAFEALHNIAVLEEHIYGECTSQAIDMANRIELGMMGNKEINSLSVLDEAQRKRRKKYKLD